MCGSASFCFFIERILAMSSAGVGKFAEVDGGVVVAATEGLVVAAADACVEVGAEGDLASNIAAQNGQAIAIARTDGTNRCFMMTLVRTTADIPGAGAGAGARAAREPRIISSANGRA
jgi:hypothetical protein